MKKILFILFFSGYAIQQIYSQSLPANNTTQNDSIRLRRLLDSVYAIQQIYSQSLPVNNTTQNDSIRLRKHMDSVYAFYAYSQKSHHYFYVDWKSSNLEKAFLLFLSGRKYQRMDISQLVNYQVPDSIQLCEIKKSFNRNCPVRNITEDQIWSVSKNYTWSVQPRRTTFQKWDYDPVAVFSRALVQYDLHATDAGWENGDWIIQNFQSDSTDPNLYFYTIFSEDTGLEIYFYKVIIDKDNTAGALVEQKAPTDYLRVGNNTDSSQIIAAHKEKNQPENNPPGKSLIDETIHFDINSAVIKQESLSLVSDLTKWLNKNPAVKLEIDGYTDNDGNADANQILSEQRADEVKRQLVVHGIRATRLTIHGYGTARPVAPNTTTAGKAANRRVEFIKK